MSDTAQSEVLKTVSEVGDSNQVQQSQDQNQNQDEHREQNHLELPRPVVVEESKKSVNGTIGNRSPRVGMSRSGSQFLPGLHNATLPSKIAIIVGLCQVTVGGAMVLTGILAIRYQSYLFHYATGVWAGLLSAICGMLGAMCTKKGVPKPNWLCGGRKWQIHVFLLAILLSLCSVVMLAIFSTSGLLQDARTIMAVEIEDQSQLEELLDSKNTSGIVINTVLLLLSILQVLLCFSCLGIAVRVLFKSQRNSSLLSSKESTGSEIAIREEYHARKNHLIHWLGHNGQSPKSSHWQNIIPLGFGGSHPHKSMPKYPTLVAIQPVAYPNHRRMISYPNRQPGMQPGSVILPHMAPQYALAPQMIPMPICAVHGATPTPSIIMSTHRRRSGTPAGSSIVSLAVPGDQRRQRRRSHNNSMIINNMNNNNMNRSNANSVKSFQTHSHRSPSVISAKTESEKNNEVEIEEVDISCTYTGLDRDIADDFISSMSMSRKESSGEDFSERGSSFRN